MPFSFRSTKASVHRVAVSVGKDKSLRGARTVCAKCLCLAEGQRDQVLLPVSWIKCESYPGSTFLSRFLCLNCNRCATGRSSEWGLVGG